MKVLGKGTFIQMSAADRGIVDEIIFALNILDKEVEILLNLKMI